jgi:hypothetical protein
MVLVGRFLYFKSLTNGTVLWSAACAVELKLRQIDEWTDGLERRPSTVPTVAVLMETLARVDKEIATVEEAEFAGDWATTSDENGPSEGY